MISFCTRGKGLALLLGAMLTGTTAALAGQVVYVDASAPAGGDGQSWATAFRYLRDAAYLAECIDGAEIRVAQGVYRPDVDSPFSFRWRVTLLGGFAGRSSSTPDVRDPKAYPTVLNAELEQVNAWCLIYISSAQPVLIDGFTMTGASGFAVSCGGAGGENPEVTVQDCVLRRNAGAIRCFNNDLKLSRVVISDNTDYPNSTDFLKDVSMFEAYDSSVRLSECTIEDNSLAYQRSVIACSKGTLNLTDCILRRNHSDYGIVRTSETIVEVSNCVWADNIVGSSSALTISTADMANVRKARFERNVGRYQGSGINLKDIVRAEISDCLFESNVGKSGGAVYVEGGNDWFSRCQFSKNRTVPDPTRPWDNAFSISNGGALYCAGNVFLQACQFLQNTSPSAGGAVYCTAGHEMTLANCILAGNSAPQGGAVWLSGYSGYETNASLVHCLVVNNFSTYDGSAAIGGTEATVVAHNSIFWDGVNPPFGTLSATASRCCIQDASAGDGQVYPGEGNIDTPPGFALTSDYHLGADSPCIDAGGIGGVNELPEFDLDGQSRIIDGNGDGSALPDIGPYEYNPDASVLLAAERIELFIPHGSQTTRTEQLQITPVGREASWTIDGGESWLGVSPKTGICQANSSSNISLTFDFSQLGVGTYTSDLTIESPTAINSPRTIQVVVHLTAPYHVPWTHPTIQAAMDAAPAGETVLVADGVYTGQGNCDLKNNGKALSVVSEHGPDATRIYCESTTNGFVLTGASRATVSGFQINFLGKPGIFCNQADPLITNCTFKLQRIAIDRLPAPIPAISLQDSSGEIRDCTLCELSSTVIDCTQSSPLIIGCNISHNNNESARGILNCGYSSHPSITRCTFSGNSSWDGVIFCAENSSVNVSNCTIVNNVVKGSGVIILYSNAESTISDSVMNGNSPRAVSSSGAPVALINCELHGNGYSDPNGPHGSAVSITAARLIVEACTIDSNTFGVQTDSGLTIHDSWLTNNQGFAVCSQSGVVNLADCILEANRFGALVADAGSVNITRCLFRSNTGSRGAAVSATFTLTELAITDSVFSGNSGVYQGGAVYCQANKVAIANSLFSGNSSDLYGAASISNYQGETSIINCAFFGNRAVRSCGGLSLNTQGPLKVTNSIFWGNRAPSAPQGSLVGSGLDRIVSRCVIEGGIAGMLGRGTPPVSSFIRTSDPLFVRPGQWDNKGTAEFWDDTWTEGDYRLTFGSPCIDAGDSTALPASVSLDLGGLPRFMDELSHPDTGVPGEGRAVVDIGPYEYAPTVLGRYVFYNNSAFDRGTPGADPADDGAIATDKTALLPGQTANTANYINYVRGINGVMLDVSHVAADPTATAFEFSVLGPGDTAWRAGPLPLSISLRPGAGVGGSDRITLIWADKAVPNNHWLRIRVKSDRSGGQLGLAADDVFCFGLAIGETGNPVEGRTMVDATDAQEVRSHFSAGQVLVPATDPFDLNRDGRVNIGDMSVAKLHRTVGVNSLWLLALPDELEKATGGAE